MTLSAEDQLAIQQLYARYNHAIDSGKAEAWADCFTPDGIFSSAMSGVAQGQEALAAFAKSFAERLTARHWTNNLVLEAAGDGARGTCYLQLLTPTTKEKPAAIIATAIYEDQLTKTAEGWRFTSRNVKTD